MAQGAPIVPTIALVSLGVVENLRYFDSAVANSLSLDAELNTQIAKELVRARRKGVDHCKPDRRGQTACLQSLRVKYSLMQQRCMGGGRGRGREEGKGEGVAKQRCLRRILRIQYSRPGCPVCPPSSLTDFSGG